jgi:hypothetical protein
MTGRTVSAVQFETEIWEKSDPAKSSSPRTNKSSTSNSIGEMFVAVILLSESHEAILIVNGSAGALVELDELVVGIGLDKIQWSIINVSSNAQFLKSMIFSKYSTINFGFAADDDVTDDDDDATTVDDDDADADATTADVPFNTKVFKELGSSPFITTLTSSFTS